MSSATHNAIKTVIILITQCQVIYSHNPDNTVPGNLQGRLEIWSLTSQFHSWNIKWHFWSQKTSISREHEPEREKSNLLTFAHRLQARENPVLGMQPSAMLHINTAGCVPEYARPSRPVVLWSCMPHWTNRLKLHSKQKTTKWKRVSTAAWTPCAPFSSKLVLLGHYWPNSLVQTKSFVFGFSPKPYACWQEKKEIIGPDANIQTNTHTQ